MKSYRENWKAAEKEKEASRAKEIVTNNRIDCKVSTPVSSLNKRHASSPTKNLPAKRPREKRMDMIQFRETLVENSKEQEISKEREQGAMKTCKRKSTSSSEVLGNIWSNLKPKESEIAMYAFGRRKQVLLLLKWEKETEGARSGKT